MKIEFNESNHTYLVDGMPYPNVTTILQSAGFIDYSTVPRHHLEYKQQVGKNVHLAVELFLKGILDESTVGEAERPYFEGYRKFFNEVKPQFIEAETPVASQKMVYVGTLDQILTIDGAKTLIDLKCTFELKNSVKPQTMAYFLAYNEMFPKDKCKKRLVIHLTGDGGYKLIPCTKDAEDKAAFLNALGVHNWKEKYL